MAGQDVRESLIDLVQLLSSTQAQLAYGRNVPVANVPAELVCMWFDDLYHPNDARFQQAFSPAELRRLAQFHEFYEARIARLPKSLVELHANRGWLEIVAEALAVCRDLAWTHSSERSADD